MIRPFIRLHTTILYICTQNDVHSASQYKTYSIIAELLFVLHKFESFEMIPCMKNASFAWLNNNYHRRRYPNWNADHFCFQFIISVFLGWRFVMKPTEKNVVNECALREGAAMEGTKTQSIYLASAFMVVVFFSWGFFCYSRRYLPLTRPFSPKCGLFMICQM